MSKSKIAQDFFGQGFSCAQAVFTAFAEPMGTERETALKTAAAFGAGMARQGETCGAVTGALMAIGLKYGMTNPVNLPDREKTYAIAQEFMRQFAARHQHLICKRLLGYDISTPDGYQKIKDSGIATQLCPLLVADAAEILDGLLE